MSDQRDLFGHSAPQGSLFGDGEDRMQNPQSVARLPDPEEVRRRLKGLIATARAADHMPWDARRARMYQTLFPQMADWLPEDEAKQLVMAFAREVERLKAA